MEALLLKLELQYFGHLMQRTDSLEKTTEAGKDWKQQEKKEAEDDMVKWQYQLKWHEFRQGLGDSEGDREA